MKVLAKVLTCSNVALLFAIRIKFRAENLSTWLSVTLYAFRNGKISFKVLPAE
jgi:hypothetical protein